MTRRGERGQPSANWADAQALAAACVGVALLAGTWLSSRSGPAFPPAGVVPGVSERSDGNSTPEAAQAPAGTVPVGGEAGTPEDSQKSADSTSLNINTADVQSFQALPGVGPALARRIVEHRALHGPFRTPDDLLQVSGMGTKRYARLQGRIRTAETP